MDRSRLRLYVVTPAMLVPGRGHQEIAAAAVAGGADAVQLRAPGLSDRELMELAGPMGETCRQAGVLFVVNNSVEVAIACGADGVHVGQGDDPAHARDALGPGRVLGISVQSPEQAAAAEAAGADYLAVTVWATPTKPEALPLHIDGLRAVLAVTQLPVVGIGGIGVENAAEVMGAGASGVAVISAVAGARDPVAATRALKRLIEEVESSEGGR